MHLTLCHEYGAHSRASPACTLAYYSRGLTCTIDRPQALVIHRILPLRVCYRLCCIILHCYSCMPIPNLGFACARPFRVYFHRLTSGPTVLPVIAALPFRSVFLLGRVTPPFFFSVRRVLPASAGKTKNAGPKPSLHEKRSSIIYHLYVLIPVHIVDGRLVTTRGSAAAGSLILLGILASTSSSDEYVGQGLVT